MRKLVAALAAILITVSMTLVASGTASARGDGRAPVAANPFEPKRLDICDFRPYLPRCKGVAAGENPFGPKPIVDPLFKGRVIRDSNPYEPKKITD